MTETEADPYEAAHTRMLALAIAWDARDVDGAAVLLDEVVGEEACHIQIASGLALLVGFARTLWGDDTSARLQQLLLDRQLAE